jgi:PAS domain S-box-containing protein
MPPIGSIILSEYPRSLALNIFLNQGGVLYSLLVGRVEPVKDKRKPDSKHKAGKILESEDKFRTLFNKISDMVFLLEFRGGKGPGKIIEVNDATVRVLGYKREELLKMTPADFSEKISREEFTRTQEEFMKKKQSVFERQVITKRGKRIPVEVSTRVFDWKGEEVILSISRDITKRKEAEEALQESEERFRKFFENELDYCYMVSTEGKILDINKSALTSLGYRKEELVGKPLKTIYAPESRPKAKQLFEKWKKTGEIKDEEIVILTRDGNRRFVLLSSAAVRDRHGEITHSVSVQKDITDRKKADEALEESEEKYKSLLTATPDAIVSADLKGRFTYVSPRALEMYGAEDASEMIGKRSFDFVVKKDVGRALKSLKQTISGKKKINFEMTFKRKDGSTFTGEVNTSLLRDSSGKPVGVTGVIRDVEESATARRRLQESEQKFKTFAEQSPNMIFINKRGRVVYANKKCTKIMGYKREEFYSPKFDFLSLIAPEYLDMIKKHFAKHMKGKEVPSYEYALVTKKGERIDTIIATKLIDYEGEKAILGIVTEITERKKAEERAHFLGEITRQVDASVIATDTDFKIIWTNDSFEDMYGYKFDEVKGKSPGFLNAEPTSEKIQSEIYSTVSKGLTWNGEALNIRKDGSTFVAELEVHPLTNEKGEIFAYAGHQRDITERKLSDEALQESMENFKALAEHSPNMIGIIDVKTGHVLYANEKASEILGYTSDEILSPKFNFFGIITEETRGRAQEHFKNTIKGKEPPPHELSFITKGKSTIDTIVSTKIIDFMGERVLLGIVTDITARKEAEKALQKAHDKLEIRVADRTRQLGLLQEINNIINSGAPLEGALQLAVEGLRDMHGYSACDIFLLDIEKNELIHTAISISSKVLNKMEKLTGLKAAGLRIPLYEGSTLKEVVDKKKAYSTKDITRIFEDLTDNKKLQRLAGPVAQISGFKSVLRVPLIAEDEIIGVLGIASDTDLGAEDEDLLMNFVPQLALVIKKKQTEEALKESEEKYRLIIKNSPDMILLQDNTGKATYISPQSSDVVGYPAEDFATGKRGFLDIIHPDDRERVFEAHTRVLKGAELIDFEYRVIGKDRKSRWLSHTARPLLKGSEQIGIQSTVRNVTERKHQEEEMRKRLLKYSLEDGNVYMVKESAAGLSLRAFIDLLDVGYKGLIISRTPEEKFRVPENVNLEFLWLSQSEGKRAIPPKIKEVKNRTESLKRLNVVLIDRLDYLIFKEGFKNTLSLVQELRELAYLSGFIVILSIDPSTIDKQKLRLLEKETMEIESLSKARLPEDLLELLGFVYEQNTIGVKPSYGDIGKEVGASKPTVRKRVKRLISSGYALESKKGLYKVVELTDKGRRMFYS